MKKIMMSSFALLLGTSLVFSSAALAAPGKGNSGGGGGASRGASSMATVDRGQESKGMKEELRSVEDHLQAGEEEVESGEEKIESDEEKVRSSKEGRLAGLQQALQQVMGTPAEKVISRLLGSDREELEEDIIEDVLDELDKQLEEGETTEEADDGDATEETASEETASEETASDETGSDETGSDGTAVHTTSLSIAEIQAVADAVRDKLKAKKAANQDKLLSKLAHVYERAGLLELAVETQKDAVKENLQNLESYKQLSKLYKKLDQTSDIKAYVNGDLPAFDVPPVIKDQRTLVPFRAIAEALEAEVSWDGETKTVTVVKDGVEIKLVVGSNVAYVNGNEVILDVPPGLMKSRVLVPARFVSEAFGALVHWEPETRSVIIITEPQDGSSEETSAEAPAAETPSTENGASGNEFTEIPSTENGASGNESTETPSTENEAAENESAESQESESAETEGSATENPTT